MPAKGFFVIDPPLGVLYTGDEIFLADEKEDGTYDLHKVQDKELKPKVNLALFAFIQLYEIVSELEDEEEVKPEA